MMDRERLLMEHGRRPAIIVRRDAGKRHGAMGSIRDSRAHQRQRPMEFRPELHQRQYRRHCPYTTRLGSRGPWNWRNRDDSGAGGAGGGLLHYGPYPRARVGDNGKPATRATRATIACPEAEKPDELAPAIALPGAELADGEWLPAFDIEAKANAAGISREDLARARHKLSVESRQWPGTPPQVAIARWGGRRMTENTGAKQNRWRKGQSGNPCGKPRGARHKATLAAEALLDGEAAALTRKAIERALEGDGVAVRLCLERILPARRIVPSGLTCPNSRAQRTRQRRSL